MIKQTGPNSFFFDGARRFVSQSFNPITKVWLKLEMNPLKGSGGTCFGDSGGPHFLGEGEETIPALSSRSRHGRRLLPFDRRGLQGRHPLRARVPR